MQNKHIFSQAENNALCHSKFSKSLTLENTFKIYLVYCLDQNCITHSPLAKHTLWDFLNGPEWLSKTNWYYFYKTQVSTKCCCLATCRTPGIFI